MAYTVAFAKRAQKQLAKINEPAYSKIKAAIRALADNPRPRGYIKLTDRPGYRIRIGDFRVIYDIFDAELVIEVIEVGDRKNVYG